MTCMPPERDVMSAALGVLRRDRVLRSIIDRVGPLPPMKPVRRRFERAVRIIVGQQLSVKAAATIWTRVRKQCGGVVTADRITQQTTESLRSCGLSGMKVRSIQRLAAGVRAGDIDFSAIAQMDGDVAQKALIAVPGFGPWSADMYRMLVLGDPDVWAPGDAGLRQALVLLYPEQATDWPHGVDAVVERWRPHRSLACRYLWHALDNAP